MKHIRLPLLLSAALLATLPGSALAQGQDQQSQGKQSQGTQSHVQAQPEPQTQFVPVEGGKAPSVPEWANGSGPAAQIPTPGAQPHAGWPGTSRSGKDGGGAVGQSGTLGALPTQLPQAAGSQDQWLDQTKRQQDQRARDETALTKAPAPVPDIPAASQQTTDQNQWLDQTKRKQDERARAEADLTKGQSPDQPQSPPKAASAQHQQTSTVGTEKKPSTNAQAPQPVTPRGTKTYIQTLANPQQEPAPSGPMSADDYRRQTLSNGAFTKRASDIAVQRASHPPVQEFARFEEAEQEAMTDVLADGSTPSPPQPDRQQAQALQQLRGAPDAQFDQAYVALEISGHEAAQRIQKRYLSDGSADHDLAHVAKLAQTTIREHLDLLHGLQRSLEQGSKQAQR